MGTSEVNRGKLPYTFKNWTSSGTPAKYENWGGKDGKQTVPNDYQTSQNVAGISLDGWADGAKWQWNDLADYHDLPYIVEIDKVSAED